MPAVGSDEADDGFTVEGEQGKRDEEEDLEVRGGGRCAGWGGFLSPASLMTARSCREEGGESGESRRRRLVRFVRQEAA